MERLRRKSEQIPPVRYEQVDQLELIEATHQLMQSEFMSVGGNIRDISLKEWEELALEKGEVWAVVSDSEILASLSVVSTFGEKGEWRYINHGVVSEQLRGQRSGVMDQLLESAVLSGKDMPHFVITLALTMFEKSGFTEVNMQEIEEIDPVIAEVVRQKLRPKNQLNNAVIPHICIKLPWD